MTVDTTIATNAVKTIARNVRRFRTAGKLTLDQLAAKSGVSKGGLVKLESGRSNPGISVLCQVAAALSVTVADLLGEEEAQGTPAVFDCRGGTVLWKGRQGGFARLVASTSGTPEMVELWEWELHPGETYRAKAHSAGTHEILTVASGELIVAVDGLKSHVKPGHGIIVRTDVPHSYSCAGEKAVRFRMFVAEP